MREPAKNADLHGNVPESSRVALLLIDVINDLTFEGSEPLYALRQIRQVLKGDIRPSVDLDLAALVSGGKPPANGE